MALCYVRDGKIDSAIKTLDKSLGISPQLIALVPTEHDFDKLKDNTAFINILKKYKDGHTN
jgi:hypothetical protein